MFMMGNITDATMGKSLAYFSATLASAWTSIASDAHTIISPIATLLSAIFCLLNLITWIEARYKNKQDESSKALAMSKRGRKKGDQDNLRSKKP